MKIKNQKSKTELPFMEAKEKKRAKSSSPIKIIFFLLIFSLVLPGFSFGQAPLPQSITPPENLEEAKKMGEKALEATQKELPGILEKIWKEEVLPVWQKMYDWFNELRIHFTFEFEVNVLPKIKSWFNELKIHFTSEFKKEIEPKVKEEIEKRKPVVEEEFQKEKKELKEDVKTELPKVGKSLWERFQELIK